MRKKKYTLPQEISTEISDTVELVKNNIGTLNYKIVPLSVIEFDPDNPRELAITRNDLPNGPKIEDPLYAKKREEFELLQYTAETIKKYGVRNAVEIYKHGNRGNYRLIHGERRCLSAILAGKKDIPAKVLDEKPNDFDIRLLQLIENVQREDLTLRETLNNIRQVIKEYKNHINPEVIVDSTFLEGLINCSKTHSLNVLAVLNAPTELRDAIKRGDIKSLEKAAIIAKAKTHGSSLMQLCIEGASLKQLKQKAAQQKKIERLSDSLTTQIKKRPGKQASKVNLGKTKNKAVVAKLIHLVSVDPLYSKFKEQFDGMSFEDFGACACAFATLIQIMERIENS